MAGLFEKTDSLVSKGVKSAARWSGFAELCGGKLAPPSFYGVDFDFSPLAPVLPSPPSFPFSPSLLPPTLPLELSGDRSGLRELAVLCVRSSRGVVTPAVLSEVCQIRVGIRIR